MKIKSHPPTCTYGDLEKLCHSQFPYQENGASPRGYVQFCLRLNKIVDVKFMKIRSYFPKINCTY